MSEASAKSTVVADRNRVRFGRNLEFQKALRQRVDEYFKKTGKSPRDAWQMYVKSAVYLALFAGLYAALVFGTAPLASALGAPAWAIALPLSILLGLATAGIAFNIQHDGGHHAYSKSNVINQLAACTLDMIGGSSYIWDWKHDVLHHTYTNIDGHDTDIELGILGRLSPHQDRLWFHRFQQFYLWPLYGLLVIKWHLVDDFQNYFAGHLNGTRFPRPHGKKLAIFWGGKLFFFSWAFALPIWWGMHSGAYAWWAVPVFYAVGAVMLGMVLSVVFQLAHAVEHAEFAKPHGNPETIDAAWAVHQVESTVDFGRSNPFLALCLGGLNFQIEHHSLPRVCHVHYPAITKLVEETCKEFGVAYREHTSFWSGVGSHFRHLRAMGRASEA